MDDANNTLLAQVDHLYAEYDHLAPPIGLDGTPYPYFEHLRDVALASAQPIGWSEKHGGFWVVTSYAECQNIIANPVDFSSAGVIFPKYAVTEPLMLAEQDEPEHMRGRRLVNLSFMPKNVANYADAIKTAVHQLIDGFIEDGRADVGKIIAEPIPAIVTALLMGLPAEDGPLFDAWTTACTHEFLADPVAAAPKIADMYAYFEQNIARRKQEPGDDVLSQVINAKIDGDSLTHKELLGFSTVLLIGGIENSAKLIGTALWRLAWDIELRRRLIAHPQWITAAIDEFLRYYSPGTVGRIVTNDITIAGKTMRRGQQVILALPIANRDPREFPHPDCFMIDRPNNRHLALGTGLHSCLGGHLIRMEARVVLTEFLSRIGSFRLDTSLPTNWIRGQVTGMSRVPILFDPGQRLSSERGAGVDAWLQHASRA